MPDYGHGLRFGAFITPAHSGVADPVELAVTAEYVGLDLVTFQDHPYQTAFYDTWTLLSWVAAKTRRIGLSGNVLNLPLRQPAVLARSVASLDRLSGGRVNMALGAGAFWQAIGAMGGPVRSPGQAVDALTEALQIINQIWNAHAFGGVRVDGRYYRVAGAKRGPEPAHDIPIWLGAYGLRMLRLTGSVADGWLPSQSYLQPGDLTRGNAIIDAAAVAAGRDPREITRLLNISSDQTADDLTRLALQEGVSVFIIGTDDRDTLIDFAIHTARQVREQVAGARASLEAAPASA